MNHATRAVQVCPEVIGPVGVLRMQTNGDTLGQGQLAHAPDVWVVSIEHRQAVRRQGFDESSLFHRNAFQPSQVGHMAMPYRGHHPDARARKPGKVADLIQAVAGHLQYGQFLRTQTPQRDRQAVPPVVATLIAKDGNALPKHSRDGLLGAGLAYAARDRHDLHLPRLQHPGGIVQEGLLRVFHDEPCDAWRRRRCWPALAHDACGTASQRILNIVMAITRVRDDRDKELPGFCQS